MELGDVIARLEAVVNHLVTTKVLARLRRNQIGKKMFTTKDTKSRSSEFEISEILRVLRELRGEAVFSH